MQGVVELLKGKINIHEKVRNSVLKYTEQWKNNHYELLAEIINEELSEKIPQQSEAFYALGNSISPITLKRLYEGQIKESTYNDLRFLKTLEKLCIFLDYSSLNVFISINRGSATEVESLESNNPEEFSIGKKLILESSTCEFNAMITAPNIEFKAFDNFIVKDSPYRKRIELYLTKLMVPGLKLEKELSNFEIYAYQLKTIEDRLMIIDTDELWTLIFSKDDNHFPYHKKGQQTYYLKKINDEWLIWDNYNPDLEDVIKTRKPSHLK